MTPDTFRSGRAVPVDPASLADDYADVAVERWMSAEASDHGYYRRAFRKDHDPRTCGCITCADGRAADGVAPLVPLFARRSIVVPSETAPPVTPRAILAVETVWSDDNTRTATNDASRPATGQPGASGADGQP